MGNNYSQEKSPLLEKSYISNDNLEKNIIISDNEKNDDNLNFINNKNNIENYILSLTKEIKSINSKLNTFDQKINNNNKENNNELINIKKNKKKNFEGFSMYNDYIFDEMRHEYVKKKKNKFKFEIKNDIKNKFISPILDSLKEKDKEILDLKSINDSLNNELKNLKNQILINNNKVKDEISNEVNLLKKQFEINQGNLEKMIIKNNNEIGNLKKNINNDLDIIKKNYDSKLLNLNKQLEESHSYIKTSENKNNIEIEKLGKKIDCEIENLKKLIYLEIEKKEKDSNSKLEQINKFYNENILEIKKLIKNHDYEIEEIKKNMEKANLENDNLKKEIKIKNKELEILKENIDKNSKTIENLKEQNRILNKKNDNNLKQIENLKEQNELIKKDFRPKTISVFKESIIKFTNLFTQNYILNKQKRQHELKLKLFSDKKYGRVGLNNIGNTCYLNSVLQVLKNIPKFTYNIIELNKYSEKFLSSLKNLLISICSSNISSFSPLDFKTILGIENKRFSGNNQYDSTIFYISLLNIIHKKINKAKRENFKKLDISKYENKTLQEKYEIWKDYFLSKNQSFIFDLFYIFYANEIECNSCHNKTQTFQTSNFLDFPIVSEKGPIKNLEECFVNYQMIKNFSDKCSECHKSKLSQKFIILKLPPVLIINLKRVGEDTAYFNEIDIPFYLSMKKIIKNLEKNLIYELRGFIKHSGSEKSGHNYAFCKNMFDDKWYKYNDSICSSIENEPELDKIFFMCYIQIGSDIESYEYLKKIIESLNEQK